MVAPAPRIILAIDPGPTQSAWLLLSAGRPVDFGIYPNEQLRQHLHTAFSVSVVVIEEMQSYGMPVGREVFDTVRWSGRFEEAVSPTPVAYLSRKAVAGHLCNSGRAKDPNIRAALIDRFGGTASIRKGGPLYGIHADVWSALAIAVTYSDQEGNR